MAYTPVTPASKFSLVSANSTNATRIKNGPGTVNGWYIYNSNASARKITFHNSTLITPVATSTAAHFSLVIPGLSAANVSLPDGIYFDTGIGITTVTGLAELNGDVVGTNDLIINIFYK